MIISRTKTPSNVLISLFIMLYMCNDTLWFGTNANGIMKLLGYVAYVGLALYWILKGKAYKNHLGIALVFVVLGTITLITTGINIKIFYVFLLVILAAFFCSNVKFEDFVEAYQKIMAFLAVYSIIAFVLYEVAYPVIARFPIFKNEAGFGFINLFFDMPMVRLPYVVHRSFGIFREPGVYMIFLVLALMFELFFVKNSSAKRTNVHVIIYIIAVVFTLSTAGYLITALILILYLLFGFENQKHKGLKLIIFIVLLAVGIWLFFDQTMFDTVFGKIIDDNYSKESRMESVYANLRMISSNFEYFMTGLGFSFVEQNFRQYSADASVGDNTNTIFRIFATYGFVYAAVLMGLIFKFFIRVKNALLAVCLFSTFCLCLFNESLIVNVFLYIMAFYSLNIDFKTKKPQDQKLIGNSYK